jgi:hypothetical protein
VSSFDPSRDRAAPSRIDGRNNCEKSKAFVALSQVFQCIGGAASETKWPILFQDEILREYSLVARGTKDNSRFRINFSPEIKSLSGL